jgi:two-component system, cell cycle sensor histidine kinase and response regulator CckA
MDTSSHRLSRPTVLVVDDDDLLRWFMAGVLEGEGYRVIRAENGRVAWQLLRTIGRFVDAVVTDVIMPEMDGVELASRMAGLPNAPALIFVSAYPYHYAVADHPFLPKPFSAEQLVELLGRVVGALERRKVGS